MIDAKRIYCIEGHWNYEDEKEPSVEPVLMMLQSLGEWGYARRNCATSGELTYFLENEWNTHCLPDSILYFATHGEPGNISLSASDPQAIENLANHVKATGCLVHFGGCSILNFGKGSKRIRDFVEKTGAAAVSGYTKDVGWASARWAPAVALELMLFSSIRSERVNLNGRNETVERKLRADCRGPAKAIS